MAEYACMNPYKYYALCKCKQNVQLAPTVLNAGSRPYISVAIRIQISCRISCTLHSAVKHFYACFFNN